jgi:hypothetical protein
VAGTPVPLSSKARICGSTGIACPCRDRGYCAALAKRAARAGRKRSSTCPGPCSSRS